MRKKRSLIVTMIFILVALSSVIYGLYFQHTEHINGNNYKLKARINKHKNDIWCVKFHPDGKIFASGSVDSTIKFWDSSTGKLQKEFRYLGGITCLCFSPDGKYLAFGGYDGKLNLIELRSFKIIKEFAGHEGTIWTVDFDPTGDCLASAGDDKIILLWDVEKGTLKSKLIDHNLTVWSIKFSRDGSKIASGSFDHSVNVWDVKTAQICKKLLFHKQAIVDLAFNNAGDILVTVGDDGNIVFWDTKNWSFKRNITVPEHTQAVQFCNDDKHLLTGGKDKNGFGEFLQNVFGNSDYNKGVSIRLWEVEGMQLLQTFQEHTDDVNDVAFGANDTFFISASSDKTLILWQYNFSE